MEEAIREKGFELDTIQAEVVLPVSLRGKNNIQNLKRNELATSIGKAILKQNRIQFREHSKENGDIVIKGKFDFLDKFWYDMILNMFLKHGDEEVKGEK